MMMIDLWWGGDEDNDYNDNDDDFDYDEEGDDYDMGRGLVFFGMSNWALRSAAQVRQVVLFFLEMMTRAKFMFFSSKVFFNWSRQFEIPILSRPRKDRGKIAAPFHDQIEWSRQIWNLNPRFGESRFFCHELVLPLVIASFQKNCCDINPSTIAIIIKVAIVISVA